MLDDQDECDQEARIRPRSRGDWQDMVNDDAELDPGRGRPRSRGNLDEMLNGDEDLLEHEQLERETRGRPRSRGDWKEMIGDDADFDSGRAEPPSRGNLE